MSMGQRGSTGGIGRYSYDLSEARGYAGNDPEKIRLGDATTVAVAQVDSECYLRFGSDSNPRQNLENTNSFDFAEPPGFAYLENPATSGDLELITGAPGARATPNLTLKAIADDVSLDVSDRAGRDIGKARLMDSSGTLIDPLGEGAASFASATDSGTGAANAAEVSTGPVRTNLDIFVDTSGAATLTVEVSPDGGTTWRYLDDVSYSSNTQEMEQYDTVYPDIRAYLDQNRNTVEIGTGGVS